jgi:hypothetical protein
MGAKKVTEAQRKKRERYNSKGNLKFNKIKNIKKALENATGNAVNLFTERLKFWTGKN